MPTDAGFSIVPTTTFADCPQLDVICVPGGGGQVDADDRSETLAFLREQAAQGALRHLGLHRLAGAGRRRPAQGLQVGLPLGLARHAGGLRRRSRSPSASCATATASPAAASPPASISASRSRRARGRGGRQVDPAGLEYDPQPPFSSGHPRAAAPTLVAEARRLLEARLTREGHAARLAELRRRLAA